MIVLKSILHSFTKKIPVLRMYLRKRRYVKFYSQFINKGDLCYDIGANIGEKTSAFLKLGAKVVAVEPQKSCIRILNNKFKDKTNPTIVAKALGQSECIAELQLCDETAVSSLSHEFSNYFKKENLGLKWKGSENVQVITLDILIEQYGLPKFCKIDVEGYELEVLNGLHHSIDFLSFEFNLPFISNAIECVRTMSRLGRAKFNYSVFEEMDLLLDEWVNENTMIEILSALPKKYETGDIYVRLKNNAQN